MARRFKRSKKRIFRRKRRIFKRRFARSNRGNLKTQILSLSTPKFLTSRVIASEVLTTNVVATKITQPFLVDWLAQQPAAPTTIYDTALYPTPYTVDTISFQGGMRSDRVFLKSLHFRLHLSPHSLVTEVGLINPTCGYRIIDFKLRSGFEFTSLVSGENAAVTNATAPFPATWFDSISPIFLQKFKLISDRIHRVASLAAGTLNTSATLLGLIPSHASSNGGVTI